MLAPVSSVELGYLRPRLCMEYMYLVERGWCGVHGMVYEPETLIRFTRNTTGEDEVLGSTKGAIHLQRGLDGHYTLKYTIPYPPKAVDQPHISSAVDPQLPRLPKDTGFVTGKFQTLRI